MRTSFAKATAIVICLLWTGVALNAEQHWGMDAKEPIVIKSYDPVTQTYEIEDTTYPAQGPLIVTPEVLKKCVEAISLDKIRRDPTSVIGNNYVTDKWMFLLTDEELEARKKQLESNRHGHKAPKKTQDK